MIPFGDMDHWTTRVLKESALLGGHTRYIYEIAPTMTIEGNKPYRRHAQSPWATSSVMASPAGIVKTSTSVFPEKRGNGYCARLEIRKETCKVIGLVNIVVVAPGSIFLGGMDEPIKNTSNPQSKLDQGIPFTKKPKALQFDYKLHMEPQMVKATGFGKAVNVPGRDKAEVCLYLLHQWEDENGNIYGLSTSDSDSHLMKNSEWGACSYLSLSKYGLYNVDIKINSVNLNSGNRKRTETAGKSGVDSVYAVTGCSVGGTTTIEKLNALTANKADSKGGAYVWNQKNGQASSTTGTIYGVYDMSGTVWERTAAYVANGNGSLRGNGASIAYNGNTLKTESTKYTTVYPFNEKDSEGNAITNIDAASQQNFVANSKIYGDAVRETNSGKAGTSESGWNYSSWTSDYSYFPALYDPFFGRGGGLWDGSRAGVCAFFRGNGGSICSYGFRAVLVNK